MQPVTTVIEGNVTREPTLSYTKGGAAVAEFGVAVNTTITNGDSQREEVDFYDCKVFRGQAINFVESVHKGDRVVVVGTFRQRRWRDEERQMNRSKHECTATSVAVSLTFQQATIHKTAGQNADPERVAAYAAKAGAGNGNGGTPEPVDVGEEPF